MQYREPRWPTHADTRIEKGKGAFDGTIVNVGARGVGISSAMEVARGDRIQCEVLSRKAAGTVCWAADGVFGVWLDEPIPEAVLAQLRGMRRKLFDGSELDGIGKRPRDASAGRPRA
ncbi:hypothetical protein AIOL_000603 [Candidatus Rhodobacter oscarellae]|uniref:PilZ domain-containing protein n=1 Tax=Candidatus Rhodobacter oscarellae TaxID=1675527 RepID=A0A0J9H418_9RHOB|nr:PilZ domain-containing protein [Candidatus Rhodobacter lobularis]KMW60448.1 hypothetical protein AIOL_000603 [Candidatus Rhodobacter lobularis]